MPDLVVLDCYESCFGCSFLSSTIIRFMKAIILYTLIKVEKLICYELLSCRRGYISSNDFKFSFILKYETDSVAKHNYPYLKFIYRKRISL